MIRSPHEGTSWQVILADLALILFVTMLAGLVTARNAPDKKQTEVGVQPPQAIYRKTLGGPTLSQWLALEAGDPRARLTVYATYSTLGESRPLREGAQLWEEAVNAGFEARLIVENGDQASVTATLAYDQAQESTQP